MNNRVVLITGSGIGIGRAACVRFGQEHARVAAVARNVAELAETQALVTKAGGECITFSCDLRKPDEIGRVIESTRSRFGRIDVLVNNAGVAPRAEIEQLDHATYEGMNQINIDAVFHACKKVWPIMTAQNGGIIVNIASVAANDPFPGFATYGASKAWVVAFTKGLAEEGRARHIRVVGIAPGAVNTRMLRGPFPDFPTEQALSAEEVADMIHAVTTDAFGNSTGQTITVRR